MIRINLKPSQEIVQTPGKGNLVMGILAIAAVFAVILILNNSQNARIDGIRENIRVTDRRINDLRDVEKKVEEFKKKNEELQQRIDIISDLERMRFGPLDVMNSLSDAIPERAWINTIVSRGTNATITGIAWNEFTVADFMESLQESNYFRNVNLRVIRTETVNNLSLRSFEITTVVDYTGGRKVQDETEGEDI